MVQNTKTLLELSQVVIVPTEWIFVKEESVSTSGSRSQSFKNTESKLFLFKLKPAPRLLCQIFLLQ